MGKLAEITRIAQEMSNSGAPESLEQMLRALTPKKNAVKFANPGGFGPLFHGLMTQSEAEQVIANCKWPFYVYALCTDSGAAFYIGKGTGRRMFSHKAEADAGTNSAKCNMIRAAGSKLRYSIHLVCRDEAYAYGVEAMLINRSYGDLTNINPGPATNYPGFMFNLGPMDEAAILLADALANIQAMEAAMNRFAKEMAKACPVTRQLLADEGFPV